MTMRLFLALALLVGSRMTGLRTAWASFTASRTRWAGSITS
jgi:hypothetical protein